MLVEAVEELEGGRSFLLRRRWPKAGFAGVKACQLESSPSLKSFPGGVCVLVLIMMSEHFSKAIQT